MQVIKKEILEHMYPGVTFVDSEYKIGSDVSIGTGSYIDTGVVLRDGVRIGNDSKINWYSQVGRNARIGNKVEIKATVNIKNDVFIDSLTTIGVGSMIESGVNIGTNNSIGRYNIISEDVISLERVSTNDGLYVPPYALIGQYRQNISAVRVLLGFGNTAKMTLMLSNKNLIICIGCMNDWEGLPPDEARREVAVKYPKDHPYFSAIDLAENWAKYELKEPNES